MLGIVGSGLFQEANPLSEGGAFKNANMVHVFSKVQSECRDPYLDRQ